MQNIKLAGNKETKCLNRVPFSSDIYILSHRTSFIQYIMQVSLTTCTFSEQFGAQVTPQASVQLKFAYLFVNLNIIVKL